MAMLTGPQLLLLKETHPAGTVSCVDTYPPLKKLLALGLLEPTRWSSLWRLTEAGRRALQAHASEIGETERS